MADRRGTEPPSARSHGESSASVPLTRTPSPRESARDAGHAGAADPDEVHAAELVAAGTASVKSNRRSRRPPPQAPPRRAAACDQVGQPLVGVAHAEGRRGRAHGGQPSASVEQRHERARTQSGVRSRVVDEQAAAGGHEAAALSRCSPLPIGSGTYAAGSPTAVSSQTVLAPARQTTRSAAA